MNVTVLAGRGRLRDGRRGVRRRDAIPAGFGIP